MLSAREKMLRPRVPRTEPVDDDAVDPVRGRRSLVMSEDCLRGGRVGESVRNESLLYLSSDVADGMSLGVASFELLPGKRRCASSWWPGCMWLGVEGLVLRSMCDASSPGLGDSALLGLRDNSDNRLAKLLWVGTDPLSDATRRDAVSAPEALPD